MLTINSISTNVPTTQLQYTRSAFEGFDKPQAPASDSFHCTIDGKEVDKKELWQLIKKNPGKSLIGASVVVGATAIAIVAALAVTASLCGAILSPVLVPLGLGALVYKAFKK
ncbi:MAG: hypothetical protein WC197_10080 [Candidatus Gastranaerophilaceae bacterium]|jgi:hypothetical protein